MKRDAIPLEKDERHSSAGEAILSHNAGAGHYSRLAALLDMGARREIDTAKNAS